MLDEPTIGLDLASKERLRTFLSAVNARGDVTLLLTTHDLPDVERLCRRVVVIDRGSVLVDDELSALRRGFAANRTLVVELSSPAAALDGLRGVVEVTVEAQDLRQRLTFDSTTTAAELIAAVARRVELRDVHRGAVHRGPGADPLRDVTGRAHLTLFGQRRAAGRGRQAPSEAATPGIAPLRNASTKSA